MFKQVHTMKWFAVKQQQCVVLLMVILKNFMFLFLSNIGVFCQIQGGSDMMINFYSEIPMNNMTGSFQIYNS